MAIAIHPYISGQPFRIKYLEDIYAYMSKFPRRAALERRGDPRLVRQEQGGEVTDFVIPRPAAATLAVVGDEARFPVRRIYCVGRNYVDHIREMKEADERDPPFFFQKPTDAIVEDGGVVAYPPITADLQYEVELVIAIGQGGRDIPVDRALGHIFGYAIGLDMTRRDRQRESGKKGLPWEIGKSFDQSAPCGPVHPVAAVGPQAHRQHEPRGERRDEAEHRPRQHDLERAGNRVEPFGAVPARARRPHLLGHAGRRVARRARAIASSVRSTVSAR